MRFQSVHNLRSATRLVFAMIVFAACACSIACSIPNATITSVQHNSGANTSSNATITSVQHNSGANTSGGPSVAVAFSSNVTAGDLVLVAESGWNGGGSLGTPTDSQGNTFAQLVTSSAGATNVAIYLAAAKSSAADTVTCNNAANCLIYEVSGATSSVDQTGTSTSTGTSLSVSTSAATMNANDYVLAVFAGSDSESTFTAGSGWGDTASSHDTSYDDAFAEDKIVSATGTQKATATASVSDTYTNVIVALEGATSGVIPAAPTNLTARAVSSSQINLSWTVSSSTTSYNVLRSTTSGSGYNTIATGVPTDSYLDTGLSASTTYYYVVQAVNSYGTSPDSAQASANPSTSYCAAAPSAPTGLAASGTTGLGTNLSWSAVTPPANCTITNYTVLENGTVLGTTTGTAYSVTGLSPSTTYTFTLKATDSDGTSFTSSGLNVTTLNNNGVYYVSPSGSDSSAGTLASPFQTISMCASTATSGGTCYIEAGTYHEDVAPNSGITIVPYNGESVMVTGADVVTGWSNYQGAIYQASVALPGSEAPNAPFANQVFAGNSMMYEAQWPDINDNWYHWFPGSFVFDVPWEPMAPSSTWKLIVDPGLPDVNWKGARVRMWSGLDAWQEMTGTVTSSSKGQFEVNMDFQWCPWICPGRGSYYLFNALAGLTSQNEWYYDSNAGVLYVWAPNGVDPNTLTVSAKQRLYCFDLSNTSNVTIKDLNLLACSINSNANSSNNVLDGLNAQYISHFTSLGSNAGAGSGIILSGNGNTLKNSTIAFSAGFGVEVVGPANNTTITNNLIHDLDYMGGESAAIDVGSTCAGPLHNTTIRHNTVYSAGRALLSVAACGLYNVEFSYNNLYNAMLLSWDGGPIYNGCCGNSRFAGIDSIDHNWIHDTMQSADIGVYIDNGNGGWEISQNVIWNMATNGIWVGAWTTPSHSYIHNNSIPDLVDTISTPTNTNCGGTTIVDNMVLLPVVTNCPNSNNGPSAPGATDMNSSVQVGCNFSGCSSSGPPAVVGTSVAPSIAYQPQSVTVPPLGASYWWNPPNVTFWVGVGNSSQPVSYQWQMNGTNISGATSNQYTTPPITSADNGEVFTVQISNSVGTVTSAPAILTVPW